MNKNIYSSWAEKNLICVDQSWTCIASHRTKEHEEFVSPLGTFSILVTEES